MYKNVVDKINGQISACPAPQDSASGSVKPDPDLPAGSVQVCVQWNTVPATVIPPDCTNVHFELADSNGNILEPNCLYPPAYNVDDAVPIIEPTELCVTCSLLERFPGLATTSGDVTITGADYSSYVDDPCYDGPDGGQCKKIWQGKVDIPLPDNKPLPVPKATTVSISGGPFTYDGQPHGATVTTDPADVRVSVNYSSATPSYNSSTPPTDAGTYTVTVTITDPKYALSGGGTGSITIDKASSTTIVTCGSGPFIYDGTAQTPCLVSVTGAGGLNLTPAPSYSNNTNAGQATASYNYAGDENHTHSSGSMSFSIQYNFVGLLAPYAKPTEKAFKIGSAIPLKWQYADKSGNLVNTSAPPNPSPFLTIQGPYPCGEADTSKEISLADAGNSGYQYDGTTKTWQYNWKTTGSPAGCYDILVHNVQTGQVDGNLSKLSIKLTAK